MRWEDGRQSNNVEDRRGMRMPGGRKGGLGPGALIIALLGRWLFGINPMVTIGLVEDAGKPAGSAPSRVEGKSGPVQDDGGRFTSVVLASTERVWTEIFRQSSTFSPR